MPLDPGTKLGPYEILAPLGAGGMGEVYRARDPRLGREVAVKILLDAANAGSDARARFEREARLASSLNHPNICTLHDVGRQAETDYLVMELVEGETLSRRIERGPLAAADLLRLGVQIADALDRAHRAGIVHRDLKPGNIMVAKSGAKLMDFGLARMRPAQGLTLSSQSPTATPGSQRGITAEGTILGTIQYLSPEQLEGRDADVRSDLWALGCVLYEMATGRPAFAGRSHASVVGAIMNQEPEPLASLAPLAPPALERLVRVCLAKDPDERIQTAHDVRLQLEWIRDGGSQAGTAIAVTGRRRIRERVLAVVAVLAVATSAWLGIERWRPSERPVAIRFSLNVPRGGDLTEHASAIAVSPDGSRLAFVGVGSHGSAIWIRPMDTEATTEMEQTGGAYRQIFWSPDSRQLAFFSERGGRGVLSTIPSVRGNPTIVGDAPTPRGGSWGRRGDILFAPDAQGPLFATRAGGGVPRAVTALDTARGETSHRFPCFLPDGEHFLFAALPLEAGGYPIYVGSLRRGRIRRLMVAASAPTYASPGFLLYAREGQLVAQRFDAQRLELHGEPTTLAALPAPSDLDAEPVATASRIGSLFMLRSAPSSRRLVWLGPNGAPRDTLSLSPGPWNLPRLSPDGRSAALIGDGFWVLDLERSIPVRLAKPQTERDVGAVWAPDSKRIAYASDLSGRSEIYVVQADGSGSPERLNTGGAQFKNVFDWSPDGRYLVYGTLERNRDWEIWKLPMDPTGAPEPCVSSPSYDGAARLSPDGHWLAFVSGSTGNREVYVQSFPSGEHRARVSFAYGDRPRWSPDGRSVTYSRGSEDWIATRSRLDDTNFGAPRLQFRGPEGYEGGERAPDGRILTTLPTRAEVRWIKGILNWSALVPGGGSESSSER